MNVAGTVMLGILILVLLGIQYRLIDKQRHSTHEEALAALGRIWKQGRR